MQISNPELVCLAGVISLTLYAVMGGADYGGGFWDLMASGPRKAMQRQTIEKAIGPIWEANHVWLILMVVLLFSCFPQAFYAISIALHIPITILLFGIVFRGSAFTFRTYDSHKDQVQERWGRVFAISSTVTPVMLGVIVGAISSGNISIEGNFHSVYISPWIQPFPVAVGVFALCLFAYLAAVYLTADTKDFQLQNDFRLRAVLSSCASGAMALLVFLLAKDGAPALFKDLKLLSPVYICTAITAFITLFLLFKRKFVKARYCAAVQVALVLWGWAFAQYPYLVRPAHTISNSAANDATIKLVIWALIAGAVMLVPAFYYLYKIFKIKQILLASILGSGLLLSPLAASANYDRIESARTQLKEFEKKYGTQNKDYYMVLASLAQAYHYSGKNKEANEYYQKALEQATKQPDAKTRVANLKNSWANFLLFGSTNSSNEDRALALDLLQEQEKFLDDTKGHAKNYLNVATSYYRAKEWKLLQKIESKIQNILVTTAKDATDQNEITSIINIYFTLATLHIEKKNRQFIGTASNKEELDKASQYFQNALSLCERLPPKDGFAIEMYRRITQFYKANGKTDLAAKYTNILSKTLGSSDPAVLFPPVDLCPACGRG